MMDDSRPLDSNGDHGGDPDVIRYQSKHDSFLLRWTPTRVCKRHANDFVNCLTQTLLVSMSALTPPKADMCGATRHVRYVPEADIPIPGCRHYYSHTSL
jgi:hypothetical protein